MTRDQLEELAKVGDELNKAIAYEWPLNRLAACTAIQQLSAAIRSLLAQEPVAWMHYYSKPGKGYSCADIGEHGPDPDEGFVHKGKEPLYAAPVPAVDPEWKAEVMRLAEVYATRKYIEGGECGGDWEKTAAARAALAAHLDKLRGK